MTWMPSSGGKDPSFSAGTMLFQMGVDLFKGFAAYKVASIQAKMQQAASAHQNYMSALAAAQAQNVVNLNEIQVLDKGAYDQEQLQIETLKQVGQAEVAAGAAGVEGQSIDLVMRQFMASSARANKARLLNMRNQFRGFNQERRNIAVSAAYNKDITVVPKPSAASFMLGIGTSLAKRYDQFQPDGQKIGDLTFGNLLGSRGRTSSQSGIALGGPGGVPSFGSLY